MKFIKSAKFLCENYSNVLIPKFKTNKIRTALNKKIKLSLEVKFILTSQSYYKFKEYLKAIVKKYQTNIHEVDESYKSQCCTLCGVLSKKYDNKRIKSYICCGLKIDRDTNGSRNI